MMDKECNTLLCNVDTEFFHYILAYVHLFMFAIINNQVHKYLDSDITVTATVHIYNVYETMNQNVINVQCLSFYSRDFTNILH